MLNNKELNKLSKNNLQIKESLNPKTINEQVICNQSLTFSYSATGISETHMTEFQNSVNDMKVKEKVTALLNSEIVNISENRQVNHHKCRDKTTRSFYQVEYERLKSFAKKQRDEQVPETIIEVGIGGSYIGPQLCIEALKPWVIANQIEHPKSIRIISNVDPDHVHDQLEDINLEKALFIITSKSGSTQETMANLTLIEDIAKSKGISSIDKQCIGITCKGSLLETDYNFKEIFYIDDSIGGRFSTSSVVGMAILSLAYGTEITDTFLEGAYKQDSIIKNTNIQENAALLNACINIWFRNYCNYQALGIIPYNSALKSLPPFLQQLFCESLGKQSTLSSKKIDSETSPIIFGEPGTNAQHSFFQMLHQGTTTTPLQFIGFANPVISNEHSKKNQAILNSNLCAQITGFALGKEHSDINKHFFGNRPSTLLFANSLTPSILGEIVSFYENTVMYESYLLDINAFDQEGVELGKVLTNSLLDPAQETNPVTQAYSDLLN
jgi:glucose-6-phosphate isomerase